MHTNTHCHFPILQCPSCHYLLSLIKVKGSVVELLEVMLEETTSETAAIAEVFVSVLV